MQNCIAKKALLKGQIGLLLLLFVFELLLLSSSGVKIALSKTRLEEPIGTFKPSPCKFEKPSWAVEGEDLDCGTVSVPQRHADPDGASIELAVVIIKSVETDKTSLPLFMAQGGPGGATIDTYAARLLNDRSFLPDRDIVLVDQRGTGYSNPSLYCTEVDKLVSETIELDLTEEEEDRLTLRSMQDCRERLSGKASIDLSAFNSLENAADIDLVRLALGYEKINFYGVSYGTLLGLHYMRLYPESLKSVVLDAVVPPQTNFILNSPKTMHASFEKLFKACLADPACDAQYPELEAVFYEVVDILNEDPALLAVSDPESNTQYTAAVVDGDSFLGMTFQMLYAGSLIPALPRMIYDARSGNFDFFTRIFELIAFDRSMSLGMYYSVVCSEDADFSLAEFNLDGVHPQIARIEQDGPENLLETCAYWNVEKLGPAMDEPVMSSIPTLLLSGYFDPITPPEYAEAVAQTLSQSQHVIFPTGAHGQALESRCPNRIIQDFLNDPYSAVDSSCISKPASPEFITPKNTIDLPVIIKLLNGDSEAMLDLLILVIALQVLLSAVIMIPLIALIGHLRNKKAAEGSGNPVPAQIGPNDGALTGTQTGNVSEIMPNGSLIAKAAGWIAFFTGPILLVFSILLSISLFQLALNNDTRIWFGVPSSMSGLLLLPMLFIVLSALIFLFSIVSWYERYWSVSTRIYYTILAAAALACSLILGSWGMLTALLR